MEIKSKIIDIFGYNNEEDILELRLNILGEVVDEFRIVESTTTFCGNPKPLYLNPLPQKFNKWKDKIKIYANDSRYSITDFIEAWESPNTGQTYRWMNEFLQKEYIKNALIGLEDNDIIFVGDVDEIWNPELSKNNEWLHVKLQVYQYYLNMTSTEKFWGTVRGKVSDFKDKIINHLRKNQLPIEAPNQGWHFTSQGGLKALHKKIDDQYNKELFNHDLKQNLEDRFGKIDFINRPFVLEVNESSWPQYLIENREHYAHLCKNESTKR